ncbi:hypothetical protein VDGL01_12698 [Verticillium dahliae]
MFGGVICYRSWSKYLIFDRRKYYGDWGCKFIQTRRGSKSVRVARVGLGLQRQAVSTSKSTF